MNEFKKKDVNGNRLPEQIGKGLNQKHLKKVMAARKDLNDNYIRFRLPKELKDEFIKHCPNISESLRNYVEYYVEQSKKLKDE